MTNFKCLVLDHDDTSVKSTPEIHYPSFVNTLKVIRPGVKIDLDEFIQYNFSNGFFDTCKVIYHMTDEEMEFEKNTWNDFVLHHVPEFYDGVPEIIKKQKSEGGIECVVSHSFDNIILRDYDAWNVLHPDVIYGWNSDQSKVKPSPFPILDIIEKNGFKKEDIIVVDDLKPGLDMARAAGVKFGYSGWSSLRLPEIEKYMRDNADYFFETPDDLYNLLFTNNNR
jgi:phosphoglycolate phosphatase/pyrophosphatase PpaX